LNGRDAVLRRLVHDKNERAQALRFGIRRDALVDKVHRRIFFQHSGRLVRGGIAFDAAAGRIRRFASDTCNLKRTRIYYCDVPVDPHGEHRMIG
jgi:hypothetical protein